MVTYFFKVAADISDAEIEAAARRAELGNQCSATAEGWQCHRLDGHGGGHYSILHPTVFAEVNRAEEDRIRRNYAPPQAMDAIDVDNGYRRYPWTSTNQPGNIGAGALGAACARAKPGGDYIDRGLSLLEELHRRGLGIVRVPPAGEADKTDPPRPFNFLAYLQRQREWSEQTFGPPRGIEGVVDHIRKELEEILQQPEDLEEWIDVVILALDGAWRAGHSPEAILKTLIEKSAKNRLRQWPDWRTSEPGKAIEHVRAPVCSECNECDHVWFPLVDTTRDAELCPNCGAERDRPESEPAP